MSCRLKPLTLIILGAIMATGCASSPDEYGTEEAWREYCVSNAYQADLRTGVTVDSWDPDATTAGHRGTRTDDVLEPDVNQAPPRGC